MKGQQCPNPVNPSRTLSFDNFDWKVFETLSEYTKDKIKQSDEFKALQEPAMVHDEQDNGVISDLPF